MDRLLQPIYLTEITEIGPEVPDFLEAGLLIMFKSGAPSELAEISVLHDPISDREEPPEVGDVISFGSHEFRITAVGDKAWRNIQELGHAVFKFEGLEEAELPGEIYLNSLTTEDLSEAIKPGVRVEIRAASS